MNKKEIAEIKKNFNGDSGLFTLNRVLMCCIDTEGDIKCIQNKSFAMLSDDECEVLYESLKKTLSGTLGKNLTEYAFPNVSYEEGGAENILYETVKTKLEDENTVNKLAERIKKTYRTDTVYCAIIAHCTYSVMTKTKNDDFSGEGENVYNFVTAAFCPMSTNSDGLFYNSETNAVEKKANTDLIIGKAPADGFLYPVFSDRAPDINHVMVYTKTPKKPNLTLIEDLLDCEFIMTAESEKEKFHDVLSNVVGDELNMSIITKVNEGINDVINQNRAETSPVKIDSSRLKDILFDAGVSDEKLSRLKEIYDTFTDEDSKGFTAVNIVDNKTVVSTPDITVNVGKDAAEKVRTGFFGGKKCLIIDLEDAAVKVNGMETAEIKEEVRSDG